MNINSFCHIYVAFIYTYLRICVSLYMFVTESCSHFRKSDLVRVCTHMRMCINKNMALILLDWERRLVHGHWKFKVLLIKIQAEKAGSYVRNVFLSFFLFVSCYGTELQIRMRDHKPSLIHRYHMMYKAIHGMFVTWIGHAL